MCVPNPGYQTDADAEADHAVGYVVVVAVVDGDAGVGPGHVAGAAEVGVDDLEAAGDASDVAGADLVTAAADVDAAAGPGAGAGVAGAGAVDVAAGAGVGLGVGLGVGCDAGVAGPDVDVVAMIVLPGQAKAPVLAVGRAGGDQRTLSGLCRCPASRRSRYQSFGSW